MEEAWKLSCLRFFYGIMLHEICDVLGIENTAENREAVKEAFKKRLKVESLAVLTALEMRVFINRIAMIMSRDFGREVAVIGEPIDNTEDTSLQDFFHLLYDQKEY